MCITACIVTISPFIFNKKNVIHIWQKEDEQADMSLPVSALESTLVKGHRRVLSMPVSQDPEKWDVMFPSICALWEMSDLQVEREERKPSGGRKTGLLCQTNKGSERGASFEVNVKTEREEQRWAKESIWERNHPISWWWEVVWVLA